MPLATALVTANDPHPQLAEEAVRQALARAGLTQATGVLLFLTPEFARHAQPAVTAAARAAQCLQVAGGIAAGVLTESGGTLDRPAAAVMVFGGDFGFACGTAKAGNGPRFSYSAESFPAEWQDAPARFGGTFAGSTAHPQATVWQNSRLVAPPRCETRFVGLDVALALSTGLQLLGAAQPIDRCSGYELEALGGQSACNHLEDLLPASLRGADPSSQTPLPLLTALVSDTPVSAADLAGGDYSPVALIAANADRSITLAERVRPGQYLAWAIRQPATAEADMRQAVGRLAAETPRPAGALMCSCIGRGPYFYGNEDRDLAALRDRFPDLPILGTYGTGQLAPLAGGQANRPRVNAVVTALLCAAGDRSTGLAHDGTPPLSIAGRR